VTNFLLLLSLLHFFSSSLLLLFLLHFFSSTSLHLFPPLYFFFTSFLCTSLLIVSSFLQSYTRLTALFTKMKEARVATTKDLFKNDQKLKEEFIEVSNSLHSLLLIILVLLLLLLLMFSSFFGHLSQVMMAPGLSILEALTRVVPENKADMLVGALLPLYEHNNQMVRLFRKVCQREVTGGQLEGNNLFRGGSLTGKMMSKYGAMVCEPYLRKTLHQMMQGIFYLPLPLPLLLPVPVPLPHSYLFLSFSSLSFFLFLTPGLLTLLPPFTSSFLPLCPSDQVMNLRSPLELDPSKMVKATSNVNENLKKIRAICKSIVIELLKTYDLIPR
jgi:hypothetical protein